MVKQDAKKVRFQLSFEQICSDVVRFVFVRQRHWSAAEIRHSFNVESAP